MRISIHEAGHAIAYVAIGRPIDYAVVDIPKDHHEVQPVEGTPVDPADEVMASVAGWAAESHWYRLSGMWNDEVDTEELNGGHWPDRQGADAIAEKYGIDIEEQRARAELLMARQWSAVVEVAATLRHETRMSGTEVYAVCAERGLEPPGQALADSARTVDG